VGVKSEPHIAPAPFSFQLHAGKEEKPRVCGERMGSAEKIAICQQPRPSEGGEGK